MEKHKDKKDIEGFLCCLSILEEKTSLLYKSLAEKTELPLAKSLLMHIAYDSKKHAATVKGISDSLGNLNARTKAKDCEKHLGKPWKIVADSLEEAEKKQKIPRDDFSLLAKKLLVLESALGEEYHMVIQLRTLQFLTSKINEIYGVNLKNLKSIFESIIKDEERHRELLTTIKDLVVKQKDRITDNTPTVKYQSPDAWQITHT